MDGFRYGISRSKHLEMDTRSIEEEGCNFSPSSEVFTHKLEHMRLAKWSIILPLRGGVNRTETRSVHLNFHTGKEGRAPRSCQFALCKREESM